MKRKGIIVLFAVLAASGSMLAALPNIALQPVFQSLVLHSPVGMEEAPDDPGRFFFLEQGGRIVSATKAAAGADAREFLNITNRQPRTAVEDGLLALAFHPQYSSNRLCYIYYTQNNPRRSVISELKVLDTGKADLASERIVLEVPQPFEDHKAGQIRFGREGLFYVALGDGGHGNDQFNNGQNTATLLGKILRIDVDRRMTITNAGVATKQGYAIPPDNPFINEPDYYEAGVRKEIWAYGFRNPWRFSWDRATGELWACDVGQDSWEEINLIVKGGNYGWCVREGAHHFKPGPEGARYIDPVIEYPHDPKLLPQTQCPDLGIGMCVIGGYVYRGRDYPSLQGVYVYADYVLGSFWGLRCQGGKVVEKAVLLRQPKNITSFAEDHRGELYAVAYDGHIYSIAVPRLADK